jgi:hypothetical protein
MTVKKIESHFDAILTLAMTLSDGTSCREGTFFNYNNCFVVTQNIAKIETIMCRDDNLIG